MTFLSQSWITPTLTTFMAQIFAMEMLHQPTNILINNRLSRGFYDQLLHDVPLHKETNGHSSTEQDLRTLLKEDKYAETLAKGKKYKATCSNKDQFCDENVGFCKDRCAHIKMEGWTSDKSQVVETLKLRSSLLGLIGKKGFFVPKDVVSKNPRLSNSDFYENNKNREFIANTFKRPVSWQEYCDSYFGKVADDPERICPIPTTLNFLPGLSSITNTDSSEHLDKKKKIFDNTYYYESRSNNKTSSNSNILYKGYFANDKENNCTLYPQTCAGALISLDGCNVDDFSTFMFYNKTIKRMGNGDKARGYKSRDAMIQIYKAGEKNKEAVMIWWWYPDPRYFEYINTKYEFIDIKFSHYNQACREQRMKIQFPLDVEFKAKNGETTSCKTNCNRCWSEDHMSLFVNNDTNHNHDIICSCNYDVENLISIIAPSVVKNGENFPVVDQETTQLPASMFQFIDNFQFENYRMNQLFSNFMKDVLDKDGYENEMERQPLLLRHAACQSLNEDLINILKGSIPNEYLNTTVVTLAARREHGGDPVMYGIVTSIVVVVVSIVATIGAIIYVWINKKKKAIIRTQPKYAIIMLTGGIFIYTATLLKLIEPLPPNAGSIASVWQCIGFRFCFHFGFILFTISFFVRLHTVNFIFSHYGAHNRSTSTATRNKSMGKIQAEKMARATIIAIICIIIYVVIWTILSPIRSTVRYSRFNIVENDYQIRGRYKCKDTKKQYRWMQTIIVAVEVLILLYGIFLVRENSTVTQGAFNDSKPVALALYNGFITLMIPTFLEYDIIKADDKVLGDLIEVLAFWWTVTIFIMSYLTPKLLAAIHEVFVKTVSKISSHKARSTYRNGTNVSASTGNHSIPRGTGNNSFTDGNRLVTRGTANSSDSIVEINNIPKKNLESIELNVTKKKSRIQNPLNIKTKKKNPLNITVANRNTWFDNDNVE